jgi:hypothetical protein
MGSLFDTFYSNMSSSLKPPERSQLKPMCHQCRTCNTCAELGNLNKVGEVGTGVKTANMQQGNVDQPKKESLLE